METLPDYIRARLRQLDHDKPPPRRLLALLRELAQEYKAFLSGDAAKLNIAHQKSGAPIASIDVVGSIDGPT
jgi:hypothetical protein